MPRRNLRRQKPSGRDQPAHPLPLPQLERAEAVEELADEAAVVRRVRMAPRRRQLATAGQLPGDSPVQRALAGRVLDREHVEAVVPEQRMQAAHRAVGVDGRQQAVQGRQRDDPPPGVARPQHLVHQARVDPVEDRQIEQVGPVLSRQIAEQAHAHEVPGDVPRVRPERSCLRGRGVAIDPQRDGPAGGALLCRGQLPRRQASSEETGDVVRGETELVGADDQRPAVEDVLGEVEPRVGPKRQGHVQIARSTFQQEVDEPHRAARQALDLVEHEQARRVVPLDRLGEHSHLLHRRRRGPGVGRVEQTEIQSRLLEREREIAAEQIRRVVVVQREPADDDLPVLPVPDGVRQRRRLAESGGRVQHREAPLRQPLEASQQRRPAHVSPRQLRRQHLRPEQPGRFRTRRGDVGTARFAGAGRGLSRREMHR